MAVVDRAPPRETNTTDEQLVVAQSSHRDGYEERMPSVQEAANRRELLSMNPLQPFSNSLLASIIGLRRCHLTRPDS